MKQCPKCSQSYDDSWGICFSDSTPLVSDEIPSEQSNQKSESSCPYCKENVKHGASVCPHCRKNLGASAVIEGISALITIPILIFILWLSVSLFYNLNGLRSDANGQEFRRRAEGYNKVLDKIETDFLKLTSNKNQ